MSPVPFGTDGAYLTGDPALATHCHLPSGIFTQVSANRTRNSKGLPDAFSVPLAYANAVMTAVLPYTCTFMSVVLEVWIF